MPRPLATGFLPRTLMAGILVATLAGSGLITRSGAQITGSAHDFSSESWSGGQICQPCHTPHNADTSLVDAPLWNHQLTTATYTVYSSTTMDVPVNAPGPKSRLCLSCHDGTVALDSFGGAGGATFIPAAANLTTNLADDHPIGIRWDHQTDLPSCSNCHNAHSVGTYVGLPFYGVYLDRRLECPTCHEVHNNGAPEPNLLRITITGSQLCLSCHGK